MTRTEFAKRMTCGPLLLDGATGSNLMKAGMPKGVCAEQWILDHPQAILRLQRAYVAAGSQVLLAPTFTASRAYLGQHGLEGELASNVLAALREQDLPELAAEIAPDWDLPTEAVQSGLETLRSHLELVQGDAALLYEMI